MAHGFTYANANPAKPADMFAGVPMLRPAHRVFGFTAQQRAEWALAIAVRDHASSERHYAVCCAELGKANAYSRVARRAEYKASAMRLINKARAARRAAVKALAIAQAAVLAFAQAAVLAFAQAAVLAFAQAA
ncbi:MAG: hypothetical protein ACRYG6_07655 [Janthinobacterium lividum]